MRPSEATWIARQLAATRQRIQQLEMLASQLEAAQAKEDESSGRGTSKRGRKPKRKNGVPKDKAQSNFTDPESRIMKTSSGGFEQSYNAQIAVDSAEQIIVAANVTACAADSTELLGMEAAASANLGRRPKELLADAGYNDTAWYGSYR